MLDINGDAAREVAKELDGDGCAAAGVQVDVSDRSAVDAALGEVRRRLGPVEIMVTERGDRRVRANSSTSPPRPGTA